MTDGTAGDQPMSDLRTSIAAVLPSIFNRIADGECVEWGEMADAVIRELDADYILVPKGHTIVRWYSPDYQPGKGTPEVTPWKADHE